MEIQYINLWKAPPKFGLVLRAKDSRHIVDAIPREDSRLVSWYVKAAGQALTALPPGACCEDGMMVWTSTTW